MIITVIMKEEARIVRKYELVCISFPTLTFSTRCFAPCPFSSYPLLIASLIAGSVRDFPVLGILHSDYGRLRGHFCKDTSGANLLDAHDVVGG